MPFLMTTMMTILMMKTGNFSAKILHIANFILFLTFFPSKSNLRDSFDGDFIPGKDELDQDDRLVIAEEDEKKPLTDASGQPIKKQRRKHNRFNGMSEEEVAKKLLPDLIKEGLDILIVS